LKPHRPSTLLRITAWYFKLGGIVFAFMAVSGLISGVALQWPSSADGLSYPLALISIFAMSVALLATGVLLARRSRIGGLLGLGLTLYPFAFAISERRSVPLLELGVAGVTVVALLIVWRELEWHGNAGTA
jgi:hypothetical protein